MNKSIFALVLAFLLYVFWPVFPSFRSNETHARIFCAYGKVFVEFEERNNTWGVLMLDDLGKPLSCNRDDITEEPYEGTNYKGTI